MKILSSFTHPQVVPNLYECLCSAEHKGRYSDECGKQSSSGAPLTSIVFFFPTMEVNGAPKQPGYKLSSKYLPLCSAEQVISYRFRTTWGWVNDDGIFNFGWTIPLTSRELYKQHQFHGFDYQRTQIMSGSRSNTTQRFKIEVKPCFKWVNKWGIMSQVNLTWWSAFYHPKGVYFTVMTAWLYITPRIKCPFTK